MTPPRASVPTTGTVDTLLAFLTTSCASCRDHWEVLAAAQADLAPQAQLVVVTPSPSMEDEGLARRMTPAGAYLHMGSETWFMYGVSQAGTFLLVRSPAHGPPPWAEAGRALGAAALVGPDELVGLVRHWRRQTPDAP